MKIQVIVDEVLLKTIDEGAELEHFTRSEYIRRAILEKIGGVHEKTASLATEIRLKRPKYIGLPKVERPTVPDVPELKEKIRKIVYGGAA